MYVNIYTNTSKDYLWYCAFSLFIWNWSQVIHHFIFASIKIIVKNQSSILEYNIKLHYNTKQNFSLHSFWDLILMEKNNIGIWLSKLIDKCFLCLFPLVFILRYIVKYLIIFNRILSFYFYFSFWSGGRLLMIQFSFLRRICISIS